MILKNLLKVIFGCLGVLFLTDAVQIYGQTNDCKTFDFNLAQEYQAGRDAYSFASADFNGDGIVDVVIPNSGAANIVSVLRGDGAGGFAPPQSFPTETAVNTVAAGDLNGDGKPDLIAGYFSGSKIVVLLNNGQGGFSAPNVLTFPANVGEFYNLKVADFNGDGNADVAGVTRTNLNFFLGNGQGGLALTTTLPWNGRQSEIVTGNFNNDNLADLALFSGDFAFAWELGVVLGSSGGAFAFNNRYTLADRPTSLVVGEFNGDGLTDVALAANNTNSSPQRFSMQPWFGNGAGGFTAGTRVLFPFTIYGLATGDFNADGKSDLAGSLGSQIATVNGVGDGTFQNKTYWAAPPSDRLLSVDANQDGKKDLLTIRNASPTGFVSVLLSSGSGDGFLAPKAIAYGGTDIAAADFNNDNLLDMVTVTDTNAGAPSDVVIALNGGNGSLLPDRNFPMPIAMRALGVGDFNGDGNKDVVTAHSNNGRFYAVRLGDGTGNLGTAITQQWFNGVENLVVGDFNNDGKDDFLLIDGSRGYTRLSNGNGTFSGVGVEYNFDSLDPFIIPQKGDFNHDGKLDLLISNGTTAKIWLGTGNGNFTLSDSQPFAAWRITAGDLNGDGNLDLIGFVSGGGVTTLRAMLGNANGTFGASFSKTIPGNSAAQIISGDFNQDSLADVAYRGSDESILTIVPSTGQAPHFGTPVFYPVAAISQHPFNYDTEANSITAADYNADGKVDIGFTASPLRAIIYNTTTQKPCISINDATVTEPDAGSTNAAFAVTLSAPSSQIVRVNYTLAGQSATVGTDLQNVSGRLEIPAGQTSATINIPITGDLLDEFDENFTINLSSPANAAIADAVAVGTIADNDAEPSLTIGDVSRVEGNFSSQQYVFPINLSAPSGKPISFRYAAANGTAVVGSDYVAVDTTRSVAPGTTTIDAYVTVLGDSTFELDESFFLNFSNPINVALPDNQARGTITNDDSVPTINLLSGFVPEGDAGQVNQSVTVQLSNPTYLPVTVSFITSDGAALSGSDYIAVNDQITVAPEQQSATANIQIVGDTINEPNEFFNVNIFNSVNAGIANPQVQILILDDETVSNDYDRDGRTDFAVFRPSNGAWYRLFSSTGSFAGTQYGASGDFPASGDYNGDGRTDITVWRPSNGVWYSTVPNRTQTWGTVGDLPVHGDYDNDGRIDLAVFRPGTGMWYIQQSSDNSPKYVQFGFSTDIPVPADYDGDGKTDVAVFRPDTGIWYVLRSSNGAVSSAQFGVATDKLVPADYDGDGRADVAVFRDGIWYVLRSSDGSATFVQWGQTGDKPVPGNYDGDAKTDYAVYRSGVWYVQLSSNGSFLTRQFGASDDIPIASVSNN